MIKHIKEPRNWLAFLAIPVVAFAIILLSLIGLAFSFGLLWVNVFNLDFSDESLANLKKEIVMDEEEFFPDVQDTTKTD